MASQNLADCGRGSADLIAPYGGALKRRVLVRHLLGVLVQQMVSVTGAGGGERDEAGPDLAHHKDVAVRYLPAVGSLNVCGDWYDAVDLADGRFTVAVGDVVGHGLEAATVMGVLRSALSAASRAVGGPAQALEVLGLYARSVDGALAATGVTALVDTRSNLIVYSSAGHPRPCSCTPTAAASSWIRPPTRRSAPDPNTSPAPRPAPPTTAATPWPVECPSTPKPWPTPSSTASAPATAPATTSPWSSSGSDTPGTGQPRHYEVTNRTLPTWSPSTAGRRRRRCTTGRPHFAGSVLFGPVGSASFHSLP